MSVIFCDEKTPKTNVPQFGESAVWQVQNIDAKSVAVSDWH